MNRLKTLLNTLILLLFCNSFCLAQESSQSRFQLLDEATGQPVVYATVILTTAKIGVISDDNGNFRIPLVYSALKDTLKISCIGYSTLIVPLEDQKKDMVNKLWLLPKIETLDEISLIIRKDKKKMSAGRIVKEAIKRIPDNYPVRPHAYIGYYRDYQQVKDKEYLSDLGFESSNSYINLNEGIIQVFDAGFGTDRFANSLNQSILFEYKTNRDFPTDTLLSIPYDNKEQKYLNGVIISPLGGNELNLLHLTDAIRNHDRMSFSFAHVFDRDFTINHIFKMSRMTYLDAEPVYEIDFVSNSRRVASGYRATGRILISTVDFGIHRLDYNLYDDDDLMYRINIAYKANGDQYFLNYITFNNHFEVKAGNYFKVDQVLYLYENSSFQVYFNEAIDFESIRSWSKQFEFEYEGQTIEILEIKPLTRDALNIKIASSSLIDKAILEDKIRYEIKQLRDVHGRILNKRDVVKSDQFREFFVQKVFPSMSIDSNYYFVDKELPLKASKKNSFKGENTYWINSPLKSSK